jgi:hypothetical protein
MAEATSQQIQRFANERVRVRAESVRALLQAMKDDRASIDDVYQGLTNSESGWVDGRTDGPPHLLAASDILAFNTFEANIIAAIEGDPQLAVVLKACVRAL